jgi:UDP-glucose 4-epimerase
MRILVTGGAGFIGVHLVNALADAGYDVVVLDNLHHASSQNIPSGVKFIRGNVRDRETIRSAMEGCTRVYHLAAQSNVMGAETDGNYSFATNVVGTYYILSCAVELGISRVIFTSSREVYGEVDRLPVTEDHPVNPKNAYGASKVAGEAYLRAFHATHGLEASILRIANVYGPGDRDRVIPLWLDKVAHGKRLELFGGEQILDFIPVDIVVAALLRAGELSLHGIPVNVGSGVGIPLKNLASRIQDLVGAQVEVRLLPARPVEVTHFVADVERMRTTLGVDPPEDPLIHLPALWNLLRADAQH